MEGEGEEKRRKGIGLTILQISSIVYIPQITLRPTTTTADNNWCHSWNWRPLFTKLWLSFLLYLLLYFVLQYYYTS